MEFEDFGIYGFDASWYQDVNATPQKIDFVKMKEYGASFAVIKVGQYTYADEDFADNWRNCKAAGLPRSGYWFGDKDDSGQAQARRFWNLVKNDQPEGMLFIDYETGSWTDWNQLYNFLKELQTLSGYPSKRIGIYTGYYYWVDHDPLNVGARNWFKQFPLWIAAYAPTPTFVKVPTPWTECLLWQDGTPAIGWQVGAESREIDHNKFNGDPNKFKEYMGGAPTLPPETGEDMILYYADLKSGYTSFVRTGAGLGFPVATKIVGPLTVSIISEKKPADGYDWYQIESPASGWIALTTSYTNLRVANPPATTAYPVESIVIMSDGTQYRGPVTKQ